MKLKIHIELDPRDVKTKKVESYNKTKIEGASIIFNRSTSQVSRLISLCGNDFQRYLDLEMAIKNNHIFYSPQTAKEISIILSINPTKNWF